MMDFKWQKMHPAGGDTMIFDNICKETYFLIN